MAPRSERRSDPMARTNLCTNCVALARLHSRCIPRRHLRGEAARGRSRGRIELRSQRRGGEASGRARPDRGRPAGPRGRNTIISINSTDPITLERSRVDAPEPREPALARLNYDDIGPAVVDRLLELGRDDALRSAQVEAFASDSDECPASGSPISRTPSKKRTSARRNCGSS